MKTLTTKVVRVNGTFNIYASENTVEYQSYASLASEMGRNWNDMTSRSKSNFRKRHADKIKPIETHIEIWEVEALVPEIFGEFQLKEAAIQHLIFPGTGDLFLRCKNGVSGWETTNFKIRKLK